MIRQPLAERLASCLLNRLAAHFLSEPDPKRKQDRSILGLISRVAGGESAFELGDLIIPAIRAEVSCSPNTHYCKRTKNQSCPLNLEYLNRWYTTLSNRSHLMGQAAGLPMANQGELLVVVKDWVMEFTSIRKCCRNRCLFLSLV